MKFIKEYIMKFIGLYKLIDLADRLFKLLHDKTNYTFYEEFHNYGKNDYALELCVKETPVRIYIYNYNDSDVYYEASVRCSGRRMCYKKLLSLFTGSGECFVALGLHRISIPELDYISSIEELDIKLTLLGY